MALRLLAQWVSSFVLFRRQTFCHFIWERSIPAAISKDDVNKGTHDKAVGEDMKAERRSGSLENTVKSPPVAPQLAIPHNNTLSKGDNDDAKSNKRRDKGDAVTTTASAWLKKPIYTTIGFAGW